MPRTFLVLPFVLLAAAVPAGAQDPLAVGQAVAGELSGTDRKDPDSKLVDTWSFAARAGVTYVIKLGSDDFDSYLRVGPADGGGCEPCVTLDDALGSDARVVLEAETGGARLIHVTTYEVGESGRYTLAVDEIEALPAPGAAPTPARRGGGVLQPGVAATGVLDEGDRRAPFTPRAQNSPYDVWTYRGSAGEPLTLALSSDDFDAYLRVYRWEEGRWRPLASNDDDERRMTRNSRVMVTLPAEGEYQVHAAALHENAAGAYTLTASREPDTGSVLAAPAEPVFLVAGGSMAGALAAGDSVADDGTFFDAYRYVTTRDTAVFELLSEELDAELRIGVRENGRWREVARGDGGGSRSRLTLVPEQTWYELRVGTPGPGRTGGYVLFAGTARGEGSARRPQTTIVPGQTRAGRLEPGDSLTQTGAFEDVWTLVADGLTTIDLRSGDFDPLLRLEARIGATWIMGPGDDDGGDGTDSRLVRDISSQYQYRVHVTTHRQGQGGAYTLEVKRVEDYDAGTPPAPIAAGETRSGHLTDTDSRDADGSYRDEWTFRGRPGEIVTIILRSEDFDAQVRVGAMVNGQWIMLKDANNNGGDAAALTLVLPEGGEYRIRAGSYLPGETGAYTLTLESRFY